MPRVLLGFFSLRIAFVVPTSTDWRSDLRVCPEIGVAVGHCPCRAFEREEQVRPASSPLLDRSPFPRYRSHLFPSS
jgi:hypothetical protein